MTTTHCRLLRSPRILRVLVGRFSGLFALDAFGHEKPLHEALPHFVMGALFAWNWFHRQELHAS